MVGKRLADAKAVATGRIDMQRGWYLVGIQLLIIVQAVDGRHGTVVMSQGNEGAWRMVTDVLLVTVFVYQLALGLLAQQVVA